MRAVPRHLSLRVRALVRSRSRCSSSPLLPPTPTRVIVSPRGLDTFRVLGPNRVAWLDLTGSGVETIAHLKADGRSTLMF